MKTMISWANTSLPLPRDHLLGSRTWSLILWLPSSASVQWGGAQQEQAQHACSCLLLEDLSWKDDMDCSTPPCSHLHRGSNVHCALCSTPPSQDGLGSCHMPQHFCLLLHKWPGYRKTRIYPLLIIASIYLLPTKSYVFHTQKALVLSVVKMTVRRRAQCKIRHCS